jgi:hypothetical protein
MKIKLSRNEKAHLTLAHGKQSIRESRRYIVYRDQQLSFALSLSCHHLVSVCCVTVTVCQTLKSRRDFSLANKRLLDDVTDYITRERSVDASKFLFDDAKWRV